MTGILVVEFHNLIFHCEPNRWLTPAFAPRVLDRIEFAATRSRIDARSVLRMRRAGGQLNLLAAAHAGIGALLIDELINRGAIRARPRRLIDRPVVPIDSQPSEI